MSSIGSTDLVLTEATINHHRDHFYQLLNKKLDEKDRTAMPMKEELHKQKLIYLFIRVRGRKEL